MELPELGLTLADLLTARGLTLALGESCTGGLVADTLTNVPGSSQFLLIGVVAYANEAKEKVLGVSLRLLEDHGAVSEEVARAMARGARALLGADLGLAITGIAGPSGATATKPVGLAYVALAGPWGEEYRRLQMGTDRLSNKRRFAEEAIGLAIAYVRKGGSIG